jgi:hypothetical protein
MIMRKYNRIFIGLMLLAGSVSAQNNADKISTLYNEGVKLIGERKFEEARKKLDASILLKADYTEAIFARGTCSLMLKEREKACYDFSKASAMGWKPAKEYVEKYCNAKSRNKSLTPVKKSEIAK